ncbi:MAG TPA: copper resistance CopC family protein [Nocardioidaceae bacterium]|nr:copper resistance CopC family protein [Nocardioidaceae bacterium]
MNKHSRRVVGGLAAVMVGGLLLLIGVGGAAAHSELIGSSPGDGQRPRGAVTEVALTFEEPVDSALTHVVVVGEGGRAKLGAVSVDRTVVRVPVTPLDVAGDYRISYRVVSADGHPVQGSIDFTVSAASARAARAMSDSAGPETAPSGQEPGSGTAPEVTAGAASGDAAAALANAATASLGDQADAPWWRTNLPLLGLIVAALMIVVVSLARRARVGQVGASRG